MSLPAEEILVIAPLQESSHAVVSRRYKFVPLCLLGHEALG
jgi:hypothetical protein